MKKHFRLKLILLAIAGVGAGYLSSALLNHYPIYAEVIVSTIMLTAALYALRVAIQLRAMQIKLQEIIDELNDLGQ